MFYKYIAGISQKKRIQCHNKDGMFLHINDIYKYN